MRGKTAMADLIFPASEPPTRKIEDVIDARKQMFREEASYLTRRTTFNISTKTKGVIGIMPIGDIHVDNHGMNIGKFEQVVDIVKNTDGLYALPVGDLVDSWIGRLSRLYAKQGVTGNESYQLVRHYLGQIKDKLLLIIGGNHDDWTRSTLDVGIIDELRKEFKIACFQDAARIYLRKPDIQRDIIIHARHAAKGNSIYNPAHAQMRAARFNDPFCDIIVSGHWHTSGYGMVAHPYSRDQSDNPNHPMENIIHCMQVTSFKEADDYAEWRHFSRSTYLQAPIFLIFPDKEVPSYRNYPEMPTVPDRRYQIMMIPNPEIGARILTDLRREEKYAKPLRLTGVSP